MDLQKLKQKYKSLEQRLSTLDYEISTKKEQNRKNTIELRRLNDSIEPEIIEVTQRATELSQLDMTPKVFFDEYKYLMRKIRELRGDDDV